MNPRPWTAESRDALLTRVTVLTAGTAVAGAVGAVGLGAALAVGTHYASATHKTARATTSSRAAQPVAQAPSTAKPKDVAPGRVQVQVLNGTGVAGAARAAANDLIAAGFNVVGIGNAPGAPVSATTITYSPAQAGALRTLAAATGVTASSSSGSGSVLVLTIGPDWTGSAPAAPVAQSNQSYNPPPAPPANNGGGGGTVVSGGS